MRLRTIIFAAFLVAPFVSCGQDTAREISDTLLRLESRIEDVEQQLEMVKILAAASGGAGNDESTWERTDARVTHEEALVSTNGIDTDVYVSVSSSNTAGYLGTAYDNGVLRTDGTIDYTYDGNDWITLGVNLDFTNTIVFSVTDFVWYFTKTDDLAGTLTCQTYTHFRTDSKNLGAFEDPLNPSVVKVDANNVAITFEYGVVDRVWIQFDMNAPYDIQFDAGNAWAPSLDGTNGTHMWPILQVTITDGEITSWLLLQHDEIHLPRAG